MPEHSDLVHVFEPHDRYESIDGRGTVQVTILRCGCGVKWYRGSNGEEWQEDNFGVRRPAHALWPEMQGQRDRADQRDITIVIRQTQREAAKFAVAAAAKEIALVPDDLPKLAGAPRIPQGIGRREARELGVWEDDWWHYEVVGEEILVFRLDPKRRRESVWRFPARDVAYHATA